MSKRHRDALGIVEPGAINPSGICMTIIDACQEVREEGGSTQKDPAIRLMVHQLAHVCGISELDDLSKDEYGVALKTCRLLGRAT